MEMRIMEPGDIAMDLSQIPNPPADKNFPRLYVIGFSRGHFGQQALVKGHVDKHADGTIQWTLVSEISLLEQQMLSYRDQGFDI